jgi:uncharacterized protein
METPIIIFVCGMAIIIGLIGVVFPLIPGVWLSLLGLFVLKYGGVAQFGWDVFWLTFGVTVFVQLLHYIIPIFTTKKFGGSKFGVWGAIIGMLLGFFSPIPFGFVLGSFVGAFVAEAIHNKNSQQALKAAFGSFVGFLITIGIELLLAFWILVLFLHEVYLIYFGNNDWDFF